ncbi:hypothetical protein [Paenibacillus sp. 1P07SE]|uniref:hypothetical protein n=1 Tax=Paenibacillus sp. 1P07SE TaxID=3132209 RepID=UPI0039A57DAA
MDYIRDYSMYAAIFGWFSFCWFGWAQERPRQGWRVFLGIGSGIGLLISILGIYLSATHWSSPTALSEMGAFRSYLIFVAIEVVLAGVGAFFLIRSKRSDYVAPWIAFIVGIHFIWLKFVFLDAALYVLAALLVAVSLISLPLSRRLGVANSAVTGIGTGLSLLAFAVLGLIRFYMAA